MITIDEIDHHILDTLRLDGRIPNNELADLVGLSPSACLRRVRRLEDDGVIRGYRAEIDPRYDGRAFVAYATVKMNAHDRDAVATFEEAIANVPGVIECHHLAGASDYLLRVEVEDLPAYDTFSRTTAGEIPGLGELTTHVVLSSPVDPRRMDG